MQNFSLTPHFELREFTESATARSHGIANVPPFEAVENLKFLCVFTLEPLREALGMPLIITSGYRSKALNDRITHHSSTSQHMNGEAADFYVGWNGPKENAPSRRELLIKAFRQIITDDSIVFDQCIIYPSFIHVSYVRNGKNRSKLTRGFGNGKYAALTRAQALALI
jgi:hypothetical protein